MREINSGYIQFIESKSLPFSNHSSLTAKQKFMNIMAYILMFAYSVFIKLAIDTYLLVTRKKPSYDYKEARKHVKTFVKQYPFHLYSILVKSLELYFLSKEIHIHNDKDIIEVAIGDGSFSKRLFDQTDVSVYAFDINPYSIDKVAYDNVKKKIVSNCLTLPIPNNSGMTLLSNNLLHHITDKEGVLKDWSKKASRLIFNENTPYCASGETTIYVANLLGQKKFAEKKMKALVNEGLQHLLDSSTLDQVISKAVRIDKKFSFYNEFVHFLAMNYSCIYNYLVQPCFGPPTPQSFKRMFNQGGILSEVMWKLSEAVAGSMIHLDSVLPRDKDAFVYYDCLGNVEKEYAYHGFKLSCVKCSGLVENNKCVECGKEYKFSNDILFLCDDDLEDIAAQYDPELSEKVIREHL